MPGSNRSNAEPDASSDYYVVIEFGSNEIIC